MVSINLNEAIRMNEDPIDIFLINQFIWWIHHAKFLQWQWIVYSHLSRSQTKDYNNNNNNNNNNPLIEANAGIDGCHFILELMLQSLDSAHIESSHSNKRQFLDFSLKDAVLILLSTQAFLFFFSITITILYFIQIFFI